MKFKSMLLAFGLAVILAAPAMASDALTSTTFTVIDGNRLEIGGHKVRLAGIVAPALGQDCVLFGKTRDCGLIARSGLLDLTAGATVSCRPVDAGGGAATHLCTANGYDLSEGMVYTGWAVPLDGAPKAYWRVLKDARARPRGFWRGTFVKPWAHVTRVSGN